MKMRNKGKIHPFTTTTTTTTTTSSSSSSSSSSPSTQTTSSSNNDVVYPVLNLLPTSIFSLISILSIQDRQVLAYMLSRSEQDNKNKTKKHNSNSPPHFECDCFNCYTSFWFRWDSSPNRDLIHQAIEAFENNDEINSLVTKGKKKDKVGRRKVDVLTTSAAVLDSTAEEVVVVVVEGRRHRALARKVLPDVMGIFNSRLWRLWSPNV